MKSTVSKLFLAFIVILCSFSYKAQSQAFYKQNGDNICGFGDPCYNYNFVAYDAFDVASWTIVFI